MKAKNMVEAWKIADEIFPTDYIKNDRYTNNAGYDIYVSTADTHSDYICDLGDRLEVNFDNGKTVNIWIEEEVEEVEDENVNAMRCVPDVVKTMRPVVEIERYNRVILCVDGSTWNNDENMLRIYRALQRGETWIASDVVAEWCSVNNILWGIISDVKVTHYPHGKTPNDGGHYIIVAYVLERLNK